MWLMILLMSRLPGQRSFANCLSVTIRYCVKTAKHIVEIISLPDNSCLVTKPRSEIRTGSP